MSDHPNPIAEEYPGREDKLSLHTGFSLYLMRQRKDDSLTKIEEIFSNVDSLGRELAPDGDYELRITGHSLGGALATILAFYAASSNVFSKVKTIRLFTYAAPRVGCQPFVHAFQYLERIGKLRSARFTNTGDIVPLIPFHGVSRSYKQLVGSTFVYSESVNLLNIGFGGLLTCLTRRITASPHSCGEAT